MLGAITAGNRVLARHMGVRVSSTSSTSSFEAIKNFRTIGVIQGATIADVIKPVMKWGDLAVAQDAASIHTLFAQNSTFSGTMADKHVIVNDVKNPAKPNPLTYYMENFLPGLKKIEWLDMSLKQIDSSFYVAGTYRFTKVNGGPERSIDGHYTFIVTREVGSNEFKLTHHQSGVKIDGKDMIKMP